jgi:hypothetical protein
MENFNISFLAITVVLGLIYNVRFVYRNSWSISVAFGLRFLSLDTPMHLCLLTKRTQPPLAPGSTWCGPSGSYPLLYKRKRKSFPICTQ